MSNGRNAPYLHSVKQHMGWGLWVSNEMLVMRSLHIYKDLQNSTQGGPRGVLAYRSNMLKILCNMLTFCATC